ncbi:MAG: choice-of-anchor B family protein [Flavobacteriales bacterium]|nr:choice-of-anchor B family protein [Flavobacteriales bacterium]
MKKSILIIAGVLTGIAGFSQVPCEGGFAGEYPCSHVDLQAYMTLNEIGGGNNTNDIWGWTDSESGREFALVGKSTGTAFVEITNPTDPVYLGTLPTQSFNSLWRDIKTYQHYAYIVSEADDHGMQVFDLTKLLDVTNPPVTFEIDGHYDGFGGAHNICINEESGFAYAVGNDNFSGGLEIIDINNPLTPAIAGGFSEDGYTHDAHIVNYMGPDSDYAGKELAFACNEDNIAIIDVTVKTDCQLISHCVYDNPAYTHQGWLTEDHKYFLANDELDEMQQGFNTRTFIFDVQDIDNPVLVGYYLSDNTSIDHNLYVIGDVVYEANYRSGLRMLDGGDMANNNMYEIAFFDVLPDNDLPQFSGSWSNYAWFESGTVVLTDMYDGFFVLKPVLFKTNPAQIEVGCTVDEVTVTFATEVEFEGTLSVTVEGLPGVVTNADSFTAPGNTTITFTGLSALSNGEYDFNYIVTTETSEFKTKGFLVKEGGVPATPVLNEPADISVVGLESVDFAWAADADATEYHLLVASDIMFTTIVVDEVVATNAFTWDSATNGTYFWKVSSTNECGTSSEGGPFSFQVLITDIAEEQASNLFVVYPNPASDSIELKSRKALGDIYIYDLSGREVLTTQSDQSRMVLDITSLTEGVYTVVCSAGTSRLSVVK